MHVSSHAHPWLEARACLCVGVEAGEPPAHLGFFVDREPGRSNCVIPSITAVPVLGQGCSCAMEYPWSGLFTHLSAHRLYGVEHAELGGSVAIGSVGGVWAPYRGTEQQSEKAQAGRRLGGWRLRVNVAAEHRIDAGPCDPDDRGERRKARISQIQSRRRLDAKRPCALVTGLEAVWLRGVRCPVMARHDAQVPGG